MFGSIVRKIMDTGMKKDHSDAAPTNELSKDAEKLQSNVAWPYGSDMAIQIIKEIYDTRQQVAEVRKDIESAVVPKFIDISIRTGDLIEHAIELWRMEQRLNKVSLDESQQAFFTNAIHRLKRYLDKNDIEIVDHTGQKFNVGRNLDVLWVEESPSVAEPIIKETKEPTILCKNQIVHKGKVIVLEGTEGGARYE